jgi:riboflavin kinase/FMN adenylyltransferase
MKIVRDPVGPEPAGEARRGSVLTIGAFDGVHLGHRAVLRLVRELADARGLAAALVTFDRHPAEIVRPESAPKLLTTLDHRLELLEATGLLDLCVVLTFDEQRSHETAEEFVDEVLVGMLGARLVVVGADFHFGHRRGGNVALLEQMGAELGFEVLGLGLVAPEAGSLPFSSTRVRELLAAGDVAGAAEVLGRPYELRGPMRAGVLCVDERMCMPADGRYSGTVTEGGQTDHTDQSGGSGGASRPVIIAIGADEAVTAANGEGPELVTVRIGTGPGPPGIVRLHARIDRAAAGVGR